MCNKIFTDKQVKKASEMCYMAHKRLINPCGTDQEIAQSLMEKVQDILASGLEIEEGLNEVTVVCGECGTHLNSSVFNGEFRVEPCPKCLQDEADYKKEQRDEQETYDSLNREQVREHNRRAG